MNKDFRLAFDVLDKVYKDNAYGNIMLSEVVHMADNKALLTKLVYGVLEKNVTLDYYISKLTTTKPQRKIQTILKLGLYILKFLNSIPDYACVNDLVELCEYADKASNKGFVNAVLKNAISHKLDLPTNKAEAVSIETSTPLWLVKTYFKQYGENTTMDILKAQNWTFEHIRANKRMISNDELIACLARKNIEYTASEFGGYYVVNTPIIRKLFDDGVITFQSPSSMLACKAMAVTDGATVLDLCSAPGGKAVFLTELAKSVKVTACDLYPQRVHKIQEYACRMKAIGITAIQMDATIRNESLVGKFDYVLCDVPCSGFGVAHKKPDIYLNKSYDSVCDLAEIQEKILNNAIDYVKDDGIIIYSTCTTLREENYNIIGKALKLRKDIVLEKMDIGIENQGFIQLLPNKGVDGFFIARLRKC